MPAVRAMDISHLEQLSIGSRDPKKAQILVEKQLPEQLMRLLSQHVAVIAAASAAEPLAPAFRSSLLLVLRIARNLCAAGDDALKQLLRADAAAWLTSSACALLKLQAGVSARFGGAKLLVHLPMDPLLA